MICRFKILGMTMVAMLAMSAVVASAAGADQFEADSYPTTVTAESAAGNGEMATEAGAVECDEHFEGTLSEASESITLTPSFTNCEAFGFLSATVSTNGCTIEIYADGGADFECPEGYLLVVTSFTCEFGVSSQTGLEWVFLANSGSHVNIRLNLSDLTYYVSKDDFLCPFNGTGHRTGISWVFNQAVTTKPISGGSSFSIG